MTLRRPLVNSVLLSRGNSVGVRNETRRLNCNTLNESLLLGTSPPIHYEVKIYMEITSIAVSLRWLPAVVCCWIFVARGCCLWSDDDESSVYPLSMFVYFVSTITFPSPLLNFSCHTFHRHDVYMHACIYKHDDIIMMLILLAGRTDCIRKWNIERVFMTPRGHRPCDSADMATVVGM